MRKMFGCLCVLFLFVCQLMLTSDDAYSGLQKVNLGVYGAQVMDITAYDNGGTTELLIAIDSIRGVYRWTTASSSSWQAVTYPTVVGKASQIEANPAAGYEDDIYVIIEDTSGISQIYASETGGISGSWVNISSSISAPSVLSGDSSGMYVGTFDGDIYRNTGGVSDTFNLLYSFGTTNEIISLAVYDSNTLFAVVRTSGSSQTIYRLNSSGSTFTATAISSPVSTPSGVGSVEIAVIGVDPADADTLFIAGSSSNPQVYKSIDGGATWSSSWDFESSGSSNFPGGFPQYVTFNNNRVFISASVLDGTSTTWSHAPVLSTTVGSYTVETHVNDGALEIDPNDSTIIYMSTDWGIGELSYSSGTWTAGSEVGNNEGIEGVVLNDLDFFEYSPTSKELWIGAKSGAGKARNFDPTDSTSTDDPTDWIFPVYPEVDGPPVTDVSINPTDPSLVFVGNNAGRVYKTENGTATSFTWTKVFQAEDYTGVFGSVRPDHSEITDIEFVPSTPTRMYLSGFNWETGTDGGVFYSDDTGDTWTEDPSISNVPVNTLWVTDNTVWAGVGNSASLETGLRARTSVTSSGTWWAPGTGLSLDNEIVTSIAGTTIGGSTGTTTVYVATEGGAYKGTLYLPTSTGFSSWNWSSLTTAIGSTSTKFTSVTVDPDDPDTAYVAAENCIYETVDGGTSWSVYSASCSSTHEDVNVLKYDDLIAGTANGLYTFTPDDTGGTALPTPASTPAPAPTLMATPTTTQPVSTPLPTPEPGTQGMIFGYIMNEQTNEAINSAKVKLLGKGRKKKEKTKTNEDGYFEFTGLDEGEYKIKVKKKGFKKSKTNISLDAGEEKELSIFMKMK